MQFGYFAGSIAGGAALTVGGYGAFGAAMGLFFIGAAATLARCLAAGGDRMPSTRKAGLPPSGLVWRGDRRSPGARAPSDEPVLAA